MQLNNGRKKVIGFTGALLWVRGRSFFIIPRRLPPVASSIFCTPLCLWPCPKFWENGMVHYLRPHASFYDCHRWGRGLAMQVRPYCWSWWSVSATAGNQGAAVRRGECGGMPNLGANAAGLATKHANTNK